MEIKHQDLEIINYQVSLGIMLQENMFRNRWRRAIKKIYKKRKLDFIKTLSFFDDFLLLSIEILALFIVFILNGSNKLDVFR